MSWRAIACRVRFTIWGLNRPSWWESVVLTTECQEAPLWHNALFWPHHMTHGITFWTRNQPRSPFMEVLKSTQPLDARKCPLLELTERLPRPLWRRAKGRGRWTISLVVCQSPHCRVIQKLSRWCCAHSMVRHVYASLCLENRKPKPRQRSEKCYSV